MTHSMQGRCRLRPSEHPSSLGAPFSRSIVAVSFQACKQATQKSVEERAHTAKESVVRLKLLVSFCAGAIFFIACSLFRHGPSHQSVLEPLHHPSGHPVFDVPLAFFEFITSPVVLLFFSVAWTYVAIVKRGEPLSWVCAFLVGTYVPSLIFHSLLGWI